MVLGGLAQKLYPWKKGTIPTTHIFFEKNGDINLLEKGGIFTTNFIFYCCATCKLVANLGVH